MGKASEIGTVIAIGSCKGGVGKTTVAVNLAMALRRSGLNVGLFDADLYGPNVPLMLGLRNREEKIPFYFTNQATGEAKTFIPLYSSRETPKIQPLKKYGLQIMSLGLWFDETTAARDSSMLGGHLVAEVMTNTQWSNLDFLVIDLPPGTGEFQMVFLSKAKVDGVVLVTTPQEMTLLDTGRSVELLEELGISILGRIENMGYLICPNCGERIDVYSTGYENWHVLDNIPLIGTIPLDHAYSKPIDAYHPFTQVSLDTPQAEPIVEIAEAIRRFF